MVTTEWAVPHAAGKFVRNLAGAESDGAWTVVRADLCKGLESGVYVNIDDAYSTRWRTRFQADGGQCSTAMADTVPR